MAFKSAKDTSTKVVLTAVAGNAIITVCKFVGWVFSSSPSMLAEAIHSLADTANQSLLFVGIKQGKKGPTKIFPWGRGQARYVWNLVSAMGIFFVGFGVTTYHGVSSLMHPNSVSNDKTLWITLSVLCFSLLVEGYALMLAIKDVWSKKDDMNFFEFLKQSDDPTILGVLFEDSIAVFGIFVAFFSIICSHLFSSTLPDSIGSIIIGTLLGVMAIALAIINGRLLIGHSIHASKEEDIKEFLESYSAVEKVMRLTTVMLGTGQVHLSVEVEFHGGFLIDTEQISRDAEKIRNGNDPTPILFDTAERTVRVVGRKINELERGIQQKFPDIIQIELEVH